MKTSRSDRLRRLQGVPAALAIAVALAVVPGCASQAPQPPQGHHVTVRKEAASLPGPTYAWFAMPPTLDAEKDARVDDPAFRDRLQGALDRAMQAKGYQRVDDMASADFMLAWRAGVRDVEQAGLVNSSAPAADTPMAGMECDADGCSQLVVRGEGGTPVAKVRSTDYTQGGLLVEAIEPKTARLLWSAFNRGTVHQGDGSQAGLDAIAAETLARLPAR